MSRRRLHDFAAGSQLPFAGIALGAAEMAFGLRLIAWFVRVGIVPVRDRNASGLPATEEP